MNRDIARRGSLLLVIIAALLGLCFPAAAAPADAYVLEPKRGRTGLDRRVRRPGAANWAFTVRGGVSAAGDLFRVRDEQTSDWTAPLMGEVFHARRFTVTLDENLLGGLGHGRPTGVRRDHGRELAAASAVHGTGASASDQPNPRAGRALLMSCRLWPYSIITIMR